MPYFGLFLHLFVLKIWYAESHFRGCLNWGGGDITAKVKIQTIIQKFLSIAEFDKKFQ